MGVLLFKGRSFVLKVTGDGPQLVQLISAQKRFASIRHVAHGIHFNPPLFKHVRPKGELTSLDRPGYADIASCEETKSDVKMKPHGSHTQPKRLVRSF